MEEPKKILKCHYLGTIEVASPTGVDTLNGAMEKVYARVAPEKWAYVDVAVAPSTITITEHSVRVDPSNTPSLLRYCKKRHVSDGSICCFFQNPENILSESRVRFLSFMGIAQKNVK